MFMNKLFWFLYCLLIGRRLKSVLRGLLNDGNVVDINMKIKCSILFYATLY